MIPPIPSLSPGERLAISRFLLSALASGEPPVLAAFLFGSKARGDFDLDSDLDVLLVCDIPPELRDRAAMAVNRRARQVRQETGIEVEPWAVAAHDLEMGRRTPMLVDALEDAIPLWPPGARRVSLPFTPADARFCASCLLDWVLEGGRIVRSALADGYPALAAERSRDDITRMASAALLLDGDTRHRRIGSLQRFERRLVATRRIPARVLPALAWARSAFPADNGRGQEHPPATPAAIDSAGLGYRLASVMDAELRPYLLDRLERIRRSMP